MAVGLDTTRSPRYVEGSAYALPFGDSVADGVVSAILLSPHLKICVILRGLNSEDLYVLMFKYYPHKLFFDKVISDVLEHLLDLRVRFLFGFIEVQGFRH
jgi:hypothetical protein